MKPRKKIQIEVEVEREKIKANARAFIQEMNKNLQELEQSKDSKLNSSDLVNYENWINQYISF